MRTVWLVDVGEYSDRYTIAVCSSEKQAEGVAILRGGYVAGDFEMWEPEDGVPAHEVRFTCILRAGRDSANPVDVSVSREPVAVDSNPEPNVRVANTTYWWIRAENYMTAEEAETAASEAYDRGLVNIT